ncbi:uncharacterized protein UHOD_11813 [Ustilago sp. UG-2017b]|nr:uncharacterized protein UHOD_11813 [Ustilago sp. UG-2017b]
MVEDTDPQAGASKTAKKSRGVEKARQSNRCKLLMKTRQKSSTSLSMRNLIPTPMSMMVSWDQMDAQEELESYEETMCSNRGSGKERVLTELSEIGRIEGSMTELVRIRRSKVLLQSLLGSVETHLYNRLSEVSRLKPRSVMLTPRSGVSVDDDEVDGVGDKVGSVGVIPGPQWTTAFGSIYIRTADLLWVAFGRQFICVASDTAPALSPESTFFIEYCTGGPSSTAPVLLELCVDSFDTAPPPPSAQDLLTGLLYTVPPPSTGDGVMGLNAQEAGRPLVHMEGAQVSGDQTDRRGEAVDLAGTGSKHGRSTVSMETMDEEACITNSHAKKDQAHMQGGLSAYARRAKRICEEGQAPPRGGPSSRSMQTRATQGFER